MPNVMLKLLDDDRHEVPIPGMSCLSAAEPIAIRVAWEPHVQRLMTASGPTLPAWTSQQVVGYLRYTGRDANVVAVAGAEAASAKASFLKRRSTP